MKPVAKSPPVKEPRKPKAKPRLLSFIPAFVRHDGTVCALFAPIMASTYAEAFAHPVIARQFGPHGRMAIIGIQTKERVSLINPNRRRGKR
jgi:hypothetical protein